MNGPQPGASAFGFLADPKLLRVLELLHRDGEEARVVGGAVRNALMGLPVHEVDITTTATPDIVAARAAAARLRCIPTGVEHGTQTLLVDGAAFEVTTLREDVETDGRHAKVRFGRDFVADALRRDFTINALSVTPDGVLFDVTGGVADIKARRVRFIGNAQARIREDYLRALRFFRFSAAYGTGELDASALAAILAGRDGLAMLSAERVRSELLKLLAAPGVVMSVAAMSDMGLFQILIGGIAMPARLSRLLDVAPDCDALLRLHALTVLVAEDAERLRARLRLSNDEHARLHEAARAIEPLHNLRDPPPKGWLREFLFARGRRAACDALMLAFADSRARVDAPDWRSALAFLADTPEPHLPFSGADLLARGMTPGRGVGETLKELQGRWIRAGFPRDAHVLAQLLDEALAATGRSQKA